MWGRWIYIHTRVGVGWPTPRGSRAWNNRGTIVEQLPRAWNISTAPPLPLPLSVAIVMTLTRCAKMRHHLGGDLGRVWTPSKDALCPYRESTYRHTFSGVPDGRYCL